MKTANTKIEAVEKDLHLLKQDQRMKSDEISALNAQLQSAREKEHNLQDQLEETDHKLALEVVTKETLLDELSTSKALIDQLKEHKKLEAGQTNEFLQSHQEDLQAEVQKTKQAKLVLENQLQKTEHNLASELAAKRKLVEELSTSKAAIAQLTKHTTSEGDQSNKTLQSEQEDTAAMLSVSKQMERTLAEETAAKEEILEKYHVSQKTISKLEEDLQTGAQKAEKANQSLQNELKETEYKLVSELAAKQTLFDELSSAKVIIAQLTEHKTYQADQSIKALQSEHEDTAVMRSFNKWMERTLAEETAAKQEILQKYHASQKTIRKLEEDLQTEAQKTEKANQSLQNKLEETEKKLASELAVKQALFDELSPAKVITAQLAEHKPHESDQSIKALQSEHEGTAAVLSLDKQMERKLAEEVASKQEILEKFHASQKTIRTLEKDIEETNHSLWMQLQETEQKLASELVAKQTLFGELTSAKIIISQLTEHKVHEADQSSTALLSEKEDSATMLSLHTDLERKLVEEAAKQEILEKFHACQSTISKLEKDIETEAKTTKKSQSVFAESTTGD